MHINPTLLLLLMLSFVLAPSIQSWITSGGTEWYRPFLAWLVVILFFYWIQRNKTPL